MSDQDYEWDERKRIANRAKHGVDFEMARRFNWDNAIVREDTRFAYGERRLTALGTIDGCDHVIVFTLRGETVRVISLRRAKARERRRYGG